jgi:hypothetical protein
MARHHRLLRIAMLALVTLVLLSSRHAEARKVRVRGGAQLLAQARFLKASGVLELSGRLIDDAREPLEAGWIEVSSASGLDVSKARGCPSPQMEVVVGKTLRVKSADNGELCLRWRAPPDKGTLKLAFGGDAYHGATELDVPFDKSKPQRLGTSLRFQPRPTVLDLDKEQLAVSGVLDLALATAHASREGLTVEVRDENDDKLASATTGGDGKVRLVIDPDEMPGPGVGKLVLKFAGNEELAPAKDEQAVTRRATVRMRIADDVEPADPEDMTEILVDVVANHDRKAVDGGVVEALLGGASVGSATVVDGRAQLMVLLGTELVGEKKSVELALRYLPSSPSYRPGPAVTVDVPIAPPSILLRVLLTIVVVAAAAWVIASWRRSKELPTIGKGQRTLTPGVHVVQSKRGTSAWKGTVVDAHEGHPLGGVKIMVRAPTLEGTGVLHETVTDEQGMFAFDLDERPDSAELITYSATHSEERKALPAGGTLRIALITRRRALLRRFVSWARVRGRPYDAQPEPTPSQVTRAAKRGQREDVVTWASAVEEAAFGPGEVDESREADVRSAEPGP